MPESISTTQIFEELKRIEKAMVTKEEMHYLIDSLEILGNPETLKQITDSREDIKAGRVKKIASARDLMKEL